MKESSVRCEDMWSCSGSTAHGLSRTGKEEKEEEKEEEEDKEGEEEEEAGYEDKE